MPKYDKDGNVKSVNKRTTTKYDGKAFERYLELCFNGGSIPEFCRQERISRPTFDDWCAKYDPAGHVKKTAKLWAEGWWLGEARANLVTHSSKEEGTTKFDTNLYKYYTGGRFGHTSDKDAHERLNKIEEVMFNQPQEKSSTAYASEPDYEVVDDHKPE